MSYLCRCLPVPILPAQFWMKLFRLRVIWTNVSAPIPPIRNRRLSVYSKR